MRLGWLLATGMCAGSVFTSTASQALTAEQLLRTCEVLLRDGKDVGSGKIFVPQGGRDCWIYMGAVQDVARIADDSLRPLIGFCAPENSTLMQFIRIFVNYAQRYPQQLHRDGAWVAEIALRQAFPCR